jgi:HEAT repeat protein
VAWERGAQWASLTAMAAVRPHRHDGPVMLDLQGVREFVRRLAGTANVRWVQWVNREPYVEHAARVEARLAAAGAGVHLRMAAWLSRVPERFGQANRDLLAAGVPMRVVQLVAAMRWSGYYQPRGEYARVVWRAGAEPVVRADLAEVLAAAGPTDLESRRSALSLLAALDLADPARQIDVPVLLADLDRSDVDDAWWYAVAALGGLRCAEAVPALLAAYRRLDGGYSLVRSIARGTLRSAVAQVMTGSELFGRYSGRYRSAAPAPEPSWEPLLRELASRDRDDGLRELAVLLLGRLRDPAHIPLLVGPLATAAEAPNTAAAAAFVLGEARVTAAADRLVGVLTDERLRYHWPKEEAARALGRLSGADVDVSAIAGALSAALAQPQPAVTRAAAQALAALGGAQAVAGLCRHAGNASAWALGELRIPETAPVLIGWLSDSHAKRYTTTAAACAEALGKIGARQAADVLAQVATGSSGFLARRNAVWALGRTDPDAGIDALLSAAADPDEEVRLQAARALASCRDRRAVTGMVAFLRGGPEERVVLRALADRPDLRAVPAVLAVFLGTTDQRTRRLAGEALRAVAPQAPDIAARVAPCLYDTGTPYRRRAAVSLLGRLGDLRYAASVAERLKDDDEITRARAAAACGRLGPPGGRVPEGSAQRIEELLRDAVSDPKPRVRANAVTAIGAWERRADVPLLKKALRDTHADVRAAATAALRRHEPS